MWLQWGSGLTGKWWNVMSNVKVSLKKIFNSLDSSNSLIPRQLAAGFFIGKFLMSNTSLGILFIVLEERIY